MIFRHLLTWFVSISALCIFSLGCSQDSSTTIINQADLPHFNDILTAPAPIQAAAKAVVRITTDRGMATGSFISPTGLLLTNNHVLGNNVCPVEGCYFDITFQHQLGAVPQDPVTVFAKPIAVDAGLDMAIAQLYTAPGGATLATPDYLSFRSQTALALVGQHVTIVGHPEGKLKKWTDGVVAKTFGDWFLSTVYVLPGDSGSPILDDDGYIVGLLHSGPTAEDLFTSNGANMFGVGSASASIMAARTAPLPNTMVSVVAATTADAFLANDMVYLTSHTPTVNVGGVPQSALSLLGAACDTALARNDFESTDDLQNALDPCYNSMSWIECRTEYLTPPYVLVCPTTSEATVWTDRYKKANQLWRDMNGQVDYDSVSFAMAQLQPTRNEGIIAGAQSLRQAINAADPVLDFELASYLAAFNIVSYKNLGIKDYIVNYQDVLHYEQDAANIVYAGTWLYYNGALEDKAALVSLLSRLYNDPVVSLGTKLYIEEVLYRFDAL